MRFSSWFRSAHASRTTRGQRRPPARLAVELLEDRSVPAAGLSATMVADILPGAASSNPHDFANVNGSLYFSVTDSTGDGGLYRSDGTAAGTTFLKTIGPDGTTARDFTALGSTVYFSAYGDLWKTNGSRGGTKPITRVHPYGITAMGGKLYFEGYGSAGTELYVSNGTRNGTKLLKDINPGTYSAGGGPSGDPPFEAPNNSSPSGFVVLNNTLLFAATDSVNYRELWRSDGTSQGTVLVKDLGPGDSNPRYLTVMNGAVYFAAASGLWRTDGTAAGTVLLRSSSDGFSGGITGLTAVNGAIYFAASDATSGSGLWKSDGTAAGTVLVKNISASNLANVGGRLFFTGTATGGSELWTSDGSAAGTVQVKDINPGSGSSDPGNLTNVNGLLYFAADDGTNGRELWQSDGTAAGTVIVRDIYPGTAGSDPAFLVGMNNKLYFAATDPEHGRELWDPPAVEPPGDRMTLVGNWHDHDHQYADVWGQRITSGPYAGDYAYLGHFANQGGIDIINITDPAHPVLASTFLGTGGHNEIVDVQVQNGIGFFVAFAPPGSPNETTGGVYIVDVSNPYAPVQLARIDPSNGGLDDPHTIFVDGKYLYEVRPKNPGIWVFDISNPANPTFVRHIPSPTGEGIHEVTVRNGRLFTADFHSGGRADIFDVSRVGDLSRPVPLLGTINSGESTHTTLATEDGQFAIVTQEWAGHPLEIYDISNPARPKLASTIHVPRSEGYSSHQPAVVGNLLYVAWFEAGVRVYDIANPYKPVLLGSYDTYTGPYGVEGECAGLEGHAHGVNSDVVPGTGPLSCGAWGVYPFLGNDKILVSDFDHGLFIVSLDNPPRLTAAAPAPHPVNESLNAGQVQPLLTEALGRWSDAGVDTSALHGIDIRTADLGGATLGRVIGNTIWLDDNAAGWGWFVDETPWEDAEFLPPDNQGEQDRMDLLTVLEHEIGHVLGHEHDADGVMQESLAPGTRRTVRPVVAADTVWLDEAALVFLAPDQEEPWLRSDLSGRGGKWG